MWSVFWLGPQKNKAFSHDSKSEKFKKCIEYKFCTAKEFLSVVYVDPSIYNANDHYLL